VSASEEYQRRLAARCARAERLARAQARIGTLRLALAAATLLLGWAALHRHALSAWWLLVPIGSFVAAVLYHARLRERRSRAERGAAFYRRGLARIEDRWSGGGQQGARFNDPHHVYAADLDLFGAGGLFELLCAARTRMGEETLARWLLAPATIAQIEGRHACIEDLRPRVDLRERIDALGEESALAVHPEGLLEWVEAPHALARRGLLLIAILLPALMLAGALLWAFAAVRTPFIAVLVIEFAALRVFAAPVARVLDGTERALADVRMLAELIAQMEQERFQAQPLRELAQRLATEGSGAARNLEKLAVIAELAGHRENLAVRWLLNVPFMYPLHVALAAEAWRAAHAGSVRGWVEAVGHFEALSSLAQYRHEHPADVLPRLLEGEAQLHGVGLGHPFIPAASCVRNDVELTGSTRVLLVSGSNMSGKSTLLRTVGINVVLAMAGAPVRAQHLALTRLQLGASIRINDSLREGSSRFYAEITRLRQLHDLAALECPLLFLLDEVLQGTNSNDRRIGAQALLAAFARRGAIGLATTHDLALTEIRGLAPGSLKNMHFQDEVANGRMQFDFRLREGVVTKSNGLELMRSIGLEV